MISYDVVSTACVHIGSDHLDVVVVGLVQADGSVDIAIHRLGRTQVEVVLRNDGQTIQGTLWQYRTKTQTIDHVSQVGSGRIDVVQLGTHLNVEVAWHPTKDKQARN